jgi:hypothetical protein
VLTSKRLFSKMRQERIPDEADERMTGSEALRWWELRRDEGDSFDAAPARNTKEEDECAN